jgi:hypothetical protein
MQSGSAGASSDLLIGEARIAHTEVYVVTQPEGFDAIIGGVTHETVVTSQ